MRRLNGALTLSPTATDISVAEVLSKLETEFASVAQAVANGEFALWVGSGISRQAPNLGGLLVRALDHLRQRAIDPASAATYLPAFEEALTLAEVKPVDVSGRFGLPFAAWPEREAIVGRLWNKYSRVLDIRVAGTASDFILWDPIDVRDAFSHPAPPTAEHLCIAILILEGAVQVVASANWDGFIEAAVDRLSGGVPGVLQVVVDPDHLRGPEGRAKLLKFHGCIVHASSEPAVFRRFLTGSHTQIVDWPENAEFAAMRNAVVGLATTKKTFVLGLSIQDNNLQSLFARAKAVHAWPWPCAPAAPAHVFCEDQIQQGQRDVLRLSYGDAYNNDVAGIHKATLLRSWAEKALIALALKLLEEKLNQLMASGLAALGKGAMSAVFSALLRAFRDDIAGKAVADPGEPNRTTAVNRAIAIWSRMVAIFRQGSLPAKADAYEALSTSTPNLIAADQNAQAAKLGCLGIALALLQHGRATGRWELRPPSLATLNSGAMLVRSTRPGAADRAVFIVKSATDAIALKRQGAFASDGPVIIHADDAWHQMAGAATSPRRVRTAPGRTGHVGETHLSLGDLLRRCVDAPTLQQQFALEMIL